MPDKKITAVGFGVGMMIFMTMSVLTSEEPVTSRVVIAIVAVGSLCGVLWYFIHDKVMKVNEKDDQSKTE